jgi:hypothetical protein
MAKFLKHKPSLASLQMFAELEAERPSEVKQHGVDPAKKSSPHSMPIVFLCARTKKAQFLIANLSMNKWIYCSGFEGTCTLNFTRRLNVSGR